MSRRLRAVGFALATVLLAACTGAPVRAPAPAVPAERAEAAQRARAHQLESIADWSMQGRLAVSVGDKGGSGRLEWRQQGPAWQASLSAPVTRQSWRLSAEPGGATLEGLDGGPRSGPEAGPLLEQATGWPIPVEAMTWWVRGLPSPGGDEVEFGADGRPQRLVAGGWTVEYQEWSPAAGGWPEMPRRLQATRDGARVRLVVDGWAIP